MINQTGKKKRRKKGTDGVDIGVNIFGLEVTVGVRPRMQQTQQLAGLYETIYIYIYRYIYIYVSWKEES